MIAAHLALRAVSFGMLLARRLDAQAMSRHCLTLFVLLLGAPASAEKRAFQLEDLYRIKDATELAVSSDGRTVYYTLASTDLPRARREAHIWSVSADGSNPRQLTYGEKSESAPLPSPDGRWLAFVSDRGGQANLYLMARDGGEARALTKLSTGVAGPVWSPDGRAIAFASDVYPECGADDGCNKRIHDRWQGGPLKAHLADALLYRHWTSWKDGTRTHILLVGVPDGEVRDLTPGDQDSPPFQLAGAVQYAFSPDAGELVFASKRVPDPASSTNEDLFLLALDDAGAGPRNITAANRAHDGAPQYSPDGRFLAYRLQRQPGYESDLFRLAVYDRRSGVSRVTTESFRNWVDDFRWAKDSQSILFTAEVAGETPLFRVDVASGALTRLLTHGQIDDFALLGDERVVFVSRAVDRPREIYAASLAEGASPPVALTRHNAAVVDEVDIRPAERLRVDGALGAKLDVFLVKPHGFDPGRRYPLILNVHGGPQMQWSDSFRGDWQVYPGAGYVVAFANPHGSTGYGQDFTAEISGDWGGAVFEDLMKVTDALAKLPYVDASRMGAMGWSYGGYMMDWFLGHTTRFKALASMMGIFDTRSFYGATEELWFPEWDLRGQPWSSPLYAQWSPSGFVKAFQTPTLVITGERDYRIPYTESLQLFTALQKMGVPSRLIVYSEAGHWPGWYEMALYYTAHLEWFGKYLGGAPPPWSSEAFLRNAVFDRETGRRLDTPEKPASP